MPVEEQFIDIDKHIEDTLVVALRVFMSLDPIFLYDDNEALSKINITATRPKDQDFVKPHVYVTPSGYSIAEASLSNGYSNDIIEETAEYTKEVRLYEYRVNFSAEIAIGAGNASTSKNLANRIASRLYIRGKKMIHDELGMVIGPISKGRENKIKLSENSKDIFINTLSLTGQFGITVSESDVTPAGILKDYAVTYSGVARVYNLDLFPE